MDIQPYTSSTEGGPTELKQQIHQLVDKLPEKYLHEIVIFSAQLAGGSQVSGSNGAASVQSSVSKQTERKDPWMEFAGMFKDDPYWHEFQEAIAEYRREVDAEHEVR